MNNRVYLDYNATCPIKDAVKKFLYHLESPHNPSAIYSEGRHSKGIIEDIRRQLKQIFNAKHVIFTASASEANNNAIHILTQQYKHIIVGAGEHPSILQAVKHYAQSYDIIPLTNAGHINYDILQQSCNKHESYGLIVQAVNSESGVKNNIEYIIGVTHQHDMILLCDMVQIIGRDTVILPDDYRIMGSLSAHKFGGLTGASALISSFTPPLHPLIHGGGQESNYRAGTENVIAIQAMHIALHDALDNIHAIKQLKLYQTMLEEHVTHKHNNVIIVGSNTERLPNTSLIIHPYMSGQEQVIMLDLAGFAVSSGSACSSGKVGSSTMLQSMGYDDNQSKQSLRISLGLANSEHDIRNFIAAYDELF